MSLTLPQLRRALDESTSYIRIAFPRRHDYSKQIRAAIAQARWIRHEMQIAKKEAAE